MLGCIARSLVEINATKMTTTTSSLQRTMTEDIQEELWSLKPFCTPETNMTRIEETREAECVP